jgi:hypothetical protein
MVLEDCPDKNMDEYVFSRRLRTSGPGTGTGRHVWFGVKGDCTIDVFVASTSSAEARTLYVAAGRIDEEVASLEAPAAQPEKLTFHYSGDITKIYLYGSGGLSIYGIRLTYPEQPTGMESIQPSEIRNQKVLRNGQLFIRRGDKTYTLQGQEVR